MKKTKSLSLLVCVTVILALLVLLPLGLTWLAFTQIHSTDPASYQENLEQWNYPDLFPVNLNKVSEVKNYHYIGFFGASPEQLFLEVSYSEEEYQKEIERLEQIRGEYGTAVKKDEAYLFSFPTYVAEYQTSRSNYEYACTNPETFTVAYVRLHCAVAPTIDEKYLPKNYGEDNYDFSIYIYPLPDENSWYN